MKIEYNLEACDATVLNTCTEQRGFSSRYYAESVMEEHVKAVKKMATGLGVTDKVTIEKTLTVEPADQIVGQPVAEWTLTSPIGQTFMRVRPSYVIETREDWEEMRDKVQQAAGDMGVEIEFAQGPGGAGSFGFELPEDVDCREFVRRVGVGTCLDEYPAGYDPTPDHVPLGSYEDHYPSG